MRSVDNRDASGQHSAVHPKVHSEMRPPWATGQWLTARSPNATSILTVRKSANLQKLPAKYCTEYDMLWTMSIYCQCPEFKFRFVFFCLQMLCFSALCGQIWKFFWGSYDLRSSWKFTKFLLIWSTVSWETQHLKAKKHKPKFEFRTLVLNTQHIGIAIP